MNTARAILPAENRRPATRSHRRRATARVKHPRDASVTAPLVKSLLESSPLPSVDAIAADLMRRAGLFDAAARRARRGDDPGAVHDLRVAVRRLLAALGVWRGLLQSSEWKKARRRLRALRRKLGPAREAEVHAELLCTRVTKLPATVRARAEKMLARLERQRDRLRARAAKRVGRVEVAKALETLIAAAAGLEPHTAVDARAASRARSRLSQLERETRRSIRIACERPDDEELHGARIAVKKWRYAIECLSPTGADGTAAPGHDERRRSLTALHDLQRTLGEIQDRAALLVTLESAKKKREADPLRVLVTRLRRERAVAVRRFRKVAPLLLS